LKRLDRAKEFLVAARRWQSVDPESAAIFSELMFALDANQLADEADRGWRTRGAEIPGR